MEKTKSTKPAKSQTAQYRSRHIGEQTKRVQVTVPSQDAGLVKVIARALRQDDDEAQRIRESIRPLVSSSKAKTGAELVAFFRDSPLTGAELPFERNELPCRT
ncbi:MAG: hypothetical protein AAFV36_06225 [Myxococcota bacterium]